MDSNEEKKKKNCRREKFYPKISSINSSMRMNIYIFGKWYMPYLREKEI